MGDRHRITKDFDDSSFVKLLGDIDRNRVKHNLSHFFTRPAYQYTKAEVGAIDGVSYLR